MKTYSLTQVCLITGFDPKRISGIVKRGHIKRVSKGAYDRESVDAYQKELEERRQIEPANWIARGNLT